MFSADETARAPPPCFRACRPPTDTAAALGRRGKTGSGGCYHSVTASCISPSSLRVREGVYVCVSYTSFTNTVNVHLYN